MAMGAGKQKKPGVPSRRQRLGPAVNSP
jgi:hypothetical protein